MRAHAGHARTRGMRSRNEAGTTRRNHSHCRAPSARRHMQDANQGHGESRCSDAMQYQDTKGHALPMPPASGKVPLQTSRGSFDRPALAGRQSQVHCSRSAWVSLLAGQAGVTHRCHGLRRKIGNKVKPAPRSGQVRMQVRTKSKLLAGRRRQPGRRFRPWFPR